MTPDAEPGSRKETRSTRARRALTKSFVEYRGYWLPHCFDNEGAIAEYWACRERAAVMDLSPLRKWEILGPDAEALVQWTITRDVRRLAVGQVIYTAMCNETGGMIDDGTVFRLGEDNFRFVGGDEYDGVWLKEQAAKRDLRVWVKPSTDQLHNIAVQGPQSREILPRSSGRRRRSRARGAALVPLHRRPDRRLRRHPDRRLAHRLHGRARLRGLVPPRATRPAVWDAIMAAGEPHGITPLGLEALDMLRIESGLIFAGYEFDDQVDPFEAGIRFAVNLDTDEDFVGRAALEERKAHPQRALVGLELDGNETAGHGDPVYVGRQRVGVVTSGTRSPILHKTIALARLAVQFHELGTEVEVGKLDGLQKRIPATVVRFPFYDPDKTRPRA